jgi:hypothetical protein
MPRFLRKNSPSRQCCLTWPSKAVSHDAADYGAMPFSSPSGPKTGYKLYPSYWLIYAV